MKRLFFIFLCLLIATPAFAKKKEKKEKTLPPGLEKKVESGKELPPGWQKKIAKGAVMEEEVYRAATPVAMDEVKKRLPHLPPSPAGTTLLRLENKIIRVMDATRVILDVFEVKL